MPGWYPDPAGAPNRFRFWDGRAWSPDTTDDPASPPPGGALPPDAGGTGGTNHGRRRTGPLILVLAVLVVLVLVGVFVARGLFAERSIADPEPLPSSTVSGWDDSSPTTEPETPSPTPSVRAPADADSHPHRGPAGAALPRGPADGSPGPPDRRARPRRRVVVPGGPGLGGDRPVLAYSWAYDVGRAVDAGGVAELVREPRRRRPLHRRRLRRTAPLGRAGDAVRHHLWLVRALRRPRRTSGPRP